MNVLQKNSCACVIAQLKSYIIYVILCYTITINILYFIIAEQLRRRSRDQKVPRLGISVEVTS